MRRRGQDRRDGPPNERPPAPCQRCRLYRVLALAAAAVAALVWLAGHIGR